MSEKDILNKLTILTLFLTGNEKEQDVTKNDILERVKSDFAKMFNIDNIINK